MSSEVRAADGRVPGRRGRETRQKLLRCTEDLLETISYRDLRVIDIARAAGTSPATFYQYFPDVEAAIVELGNVLTDASADIVGLVRDGPWTGAGSPATSAAVVDGFFELWDGHRHLLRVVDLSTAEGNLRFQSVRTRFLSEITQALTDVVRESGQPVDATAHAAAVISLLAHTAAHRYGYEFWGIRFDDVRDSVRRIVHWSLTGRKVAG